MAMNPMQRRARNSFLVGFLVALIIMALVVILLLYKIKTVTAEKDELIALQSTVLVAKEKIKSGASVTMDNFTTATVITTVPADQILSSSDFDWTDSDGNPITKIDENNNEVLKQLMMKIEVPAGTIVTKNMVEEIDDQTTDSQRIQEYNMILLPSQLVNGDFIDVRISLPSGQDYIVLSKKCVLGTSETSVWLKVTEEELLTLNNAIVEAYTVAGAKLYAIPYTEAGLQAQAIPTYTVSQAVLDLIYSDKNITQEARDALATRYVPEYRTKYFEPALDENRDNQPSLVEAGNATEAQSIQAARQTFVESLEGTEDIGYER